MKRARVKKLCAVCRSEFEVRPSELKAFATCSKACGLIYRSLVHKGRKITWMEKIKESRSRPNRPPRDRGYITDSYRRLMSERQRGEKSHFWRGGVYPANAAIRSSFDYKQWRRRVFERDDYTCQLCVTRGGRLHADHIKPFAYYPELRFVLSNGRTLCESCHKSTDTYLHKAVQTRKKEEMLALHGIEIRET